MQRRAALAQGRAGQRHARSWAARPASAPTQHGRPRPPVAPTPALAARRRSPPLASAGDSRPPAANRPTTTTPSAGRGGGGPTPPLDEEEEQRTKAGWRLLEAAPYLERWDVPWSGGAAAGWMLLWFVSFALSAFVLSPALYFALFPPPAGSPGGVAGLLRLSALPPAEQAQFTLASEAVEATVTAALLAALWGLHGKGGGLSARGLLQFFGPPEGDRAEEEEARPGAKAAAAAAAGARGAGTAAAARRPAPPFQAPRGWLAWGLLGAVAAPVVVGSTAALLSFLHYDQIFAASKGTADAVAGMVETGGGGAGGGVGGAAGGTAAATSAANAVALLTYVRLLAVTAVLAPLLEESVFRGVLLPSLTRYVPVPLAIVLSSAAFAAAHLSARDAPVLFALGCLLGVIYVRSRALASPMLVHGVWNGTVLTVLFALSASGVDLEAALHGGQAAAAAGGIAGAGAGAAGAAGSAGAEAGAAALQWMRAMMVVVW